MMIAVPEQLARGIGHQANRPNLEWPINCQPVAIAKIVSPGIPAKLDAVAVLREEAESKNEFRCRLQHQAVLSFETATLVSLNQFITRPEDQIVFVFFIDIATQMLADTLHAIAEDGSDLLLIVP